MGYKLMNEDNSCDNCGRDGFHLDSPMDCINDLSDEIELLWMIIFDLNPSYGQDGEYARDKAAYFTPHEEED
jgi:hypothetical protein